MKFITVLCFFIFLAGCQSSNKKTPQQNVQPTIKTDSIVTRSFGELKQDLEKTRIQFSLRYAQPNKHVKKELLEEITNYWVNAISIDLYDQWKNTPWDFNGTTTKPQQGSIACGFFVTILLHDMGLKINRRKLSVCASSQMMRSLAPHQQIKNISHLSYFGFNEKLKEYGKGVYIIGLDFHTGFIVNDEKENWFIRTFCTVGSMASVQYKNNI